MTRQRLQEPSDDAVIALHVDPDQRPPFLVDGLSVGGVDAFSEQRRRIREKNSGPDPVGPERNERKMAIAAGLPAARPVSAADGARALQSTLGGDQPRGVRPDAGLWRSGPRADPGGTGTR
jgi:hypothetical protein